MKLYKLALLGFGNVGQALAQLLINKEAELAENHSIKFIVTAIATKSHGRAINANGLDLKKALEIMSDGGSLDDISLSPPPEDNFEFIKASGADVLFENSPVNYTNGQPAISHIECALENGMHCMTANKGPVVHGYEKLTKLATDKGLKFYFESTVMDGAPVFSVFRELPVTNLSSIQGVLNSTTNLILTHMEEGESLEEATKYAQKIGIVEADPSGDLEGWDATIKLCALVTVLMGIALKPDQVEREGIMSITPEMIAAAKAEGKRYKLVAQAVKNSNGLTASVSPQLVGTNSAFYNISGTSSIVQFESDVLGKLSITEEDPSTLTTAYGLLADFINAVSN